MSAESLSLEETNRIRASLGLAPLAGDDDAAGPVQTEEDVAVENYRRVKEQADADRAAQQLKERLDKAKNQRELRSKLSGKGLGEASAEDGSAKAWVKKLKRGAVNQAAELAKRRLAEQAELDAQLTTAYDSDALAGLKVAHDLDDFNAGDKETILTLKDARVLDDEDDELQNVNMAEEERRKERMDLKKANQKGRKYTGYDDEEFTGSGATNNRGVLSKYDVDIKDASMNRDSSIGFTLGSSSSVSQSKNEEDSNTFSALGEARTKSKESIARELNNLNYTKNLEVSDYVQPGEASFKKPKKKKKQSSSSSRRVQVDGDDQPTDAMQIDDDDSSAQRTSQQDLEAQTLIDDEELQAALARQRRARLKKAMELRKQSMPPLNEHEGISIKEEEDDSKDGLILDATSEFVRGIQLQESTSSNIPKRAEGKANGIKKEDSPAVDQVVEAEEAIPVTEMEVDQEDGAVIEDGPADNLETKEEEEEKVLEGTAAEIHNTRGLGSTLSLLRQQGILKPLTEEEIRRDKEYKEKAAWLAQRRADELRLLEEKQASRAAGSSKDQKTREMENRMRERDQAQRDLERFKNYKPSIDIKYNDEFGREMNQKEAWKHLSHRFHGKGSGIKAQEKRLKKIADERKREAMASGDTPLSTNAAFQARQEKLGTATMILSVGNKMTAPGVEDFQTTGGLNPAKSSNKPKKNKLHAEPQINLTPTLAGNASTSVSSPAENGASPAPSSEQVPRKPGFQRINKRNAAGDEEGEGHDSKRQRQ